MMVEHTPLSVQLKATDLNQQYPFSVQTDRAGEAMIWLLGQSSSPVLRDQLDWDYLPDGRLMTFFFSGEKLAVEFKLRFG